MVRSLPDQLQQILRHADHSELIKDSPKNAPTFIFFFLFLLKHKETEEGGSKPSCLQ